MKFTNGTIETLDNSYNTVILYNNNTIVYKATYTKTESKELLLKYKNIKFI